jgi:hypothetical protein
MKPVVRALVLATGLVIATAPLVAASTPVDVNYIGCTLGNGGTATVAAGSDVSMTFGFGATTQSQLKSIIAASTVYVAIDSAAAIKAGTFSAPVFSADQWVTTWRFDTGRVLASADSMVVNVAWFVDRQVWDGSRNGRKPAKFGPGPVFDPSMSCTISAP